MNADQRIEMIVIEGGPCSGKSTGIPKIKAEMKRRGWMVLVSREIPTALCDEHDYVLTEPDRNISNEEFQKLVLGEVIRQEEQLLRRAKESGHPNVLILCDRGRFGGLGYIDHAAFFTMARTVYGQSKDDLFHQYAGCVFLTSPAVDKPEVYLEHMANNSARRETDIERAVDQNNLSLDACIGVSRMYIIDNSTSFDEKIKRTTDVIAHFLGNVEAERKWSSPEPLSKKEFEEMVANLNIHAVPVHISQTYLTLTDEEEDDGIKSRRVRGMTLEDPERHGMFFLTTKRAKRAGVGSEDEFPISRTEYEHCVVESYDPARQTIVKTRYYFVYDDRYFELDIFQTPAVQRFILELEHVPGDDLGNLDLPSFLGELTDVTEDPAFSNASIALLKGS